MATVLLLSSPQHHLPDLKVYLGHRGYTIVEAFSMRDAIQFITDKRPEAALLPTDMMPPNSRWLYGVLNQLTQIVFFADRLNAKTLAISHELNPAYILEPPLTARAFEQMLRRLERDQRKHADMAASEPKPQLEDTHVWVMSALSDLALKALCVPGQGHYRESTDSIGRVTCFRMQTRKMSGYFILVYGKGRPLDPEWTRNLQETLKKYLAEFGENTTLDPHEQLEIDEVKFNQWSKDQAQFIREATHAESELVLAFFKDDAPKESQSTVHQDYMEMGVDQLRGDHEVQFDIFIYLPQNAKFVLYTPRGGVLYENQKQKLLNDGIKKVHMHKSALEEIRRYRTKNFVANGLKPYAPTANA